MTEAGALPEEALPPDTVGGPDQRGHVGLVPPHQVCPGQERGRPGGSMTPVHQLIVPRLRILDLKHNNDVSDIQDCYDPYFSHGADEVSVVGLMTDDEVDRGPDVLLRPVVVLEVVGDAEQLQQDPGEAVGRAQVLSLVIRIHQWTFAGHFPTQ